jgi:hypothetical protein
MTGPAHAAELAAARQLWPLSSPGAADRTHTRPPADTNPNWTAGAASRETPA